MANIAQSRPGALTKSNIPVLETIKSLLRANKKPLHVLEFNHCSQFCIINIKAHKLHLYKVCEL